MISKNNRTFDAAELRKRAETIARVNTTLSPEKIKALSPEEIQQMVHDLQIHQIELEMQNDDLQRSQTELVEQRKDESQQDIAKRKQAEEKLRASEAKYRTLIENLPLKIFTKDRNSIYVSCNENFARDLGITQEEFEGKTDYVFFPKELADKYRADDHRIMASGAMELIEEQYNSKEAETFWVQTIKTPLRDDMGNITGILGVFRDITVRKRAEESLRAQEARYRCLIDAIGQSNISLFLVDADYRVRFMNSPFVAAFGDQTGRICFEGVGKANSPCGYCKLDEVIHQQKNVHY